MPIRTNAAQSVAQNNTVKLTPERRAFWHSPYTNADAKVVQQKKGLPNIEAGKTFIGNAILTKNEGVLEQMGVTRARYDDQDCLTRFNRSGFTDADVKQAKKSFDFLKGASTQEVKAYLGLKLRNLEVGYKGGMEMLQEHGITESKYDKHDLAAAFAKSGMGDRQIREAKSQYDFLKKSSTQEVKEYLGLKVINAKDGYGWAKDFLKSVGGTGGWGAGAKKTTGAGWGR